MHLRKALVIFSLALLVTFACGVEKTNKGVGPPDSAPPAQITDLATGDPSDSSLILTWTAPGDDDTIGTAAQYDLRFDFTVLTDSSWDSAFPIDSLPSPQTAGMAETLLVIGLEDDTTYYFCIKTADEDSNWSAMSNIATGVTAATPDTIPPSPITDLRVSDAGLDFIQISWTAPGDNPTSGNVSEYDIRYSTDELNSQNFAGANQVADPPVPLSPDSTQMYTFFDLDSNTTYYFAIKTADDDSNWSAISNIAMGTTLADTIPPGPISDLRVDDAGEFYVILCWTAPGDDAEIGQAAEYDIRRSTSPITTGNFPHLLHVVSEPRPDSAGIIQCMRVHPLVPDTIYYFAMRTADADGNWSAMSNVVAAYTGDTIPPATVTDLYVALEQKNQINFCWTAPGDDGMKGTVTQYDIRYSTNPINEETFSEAQRTDEEPYAIVAGGELQCDEIKDLDSGQVYYFAIKATDEYDNWSGMSNVAMGFTGDTIPPATINNLQILRHGPTWVQLYWHAPGDDSTTGRAREYDIRYSRDPITDATFEDAIQVTDPPHPCQKYCSDDHIISNLAPLTRYYFAIKTRDEMYNWSGLSNVVSVTTHEADTPDAITDLRVVVAMDSAIVVAWTAPGDDGDMGVAAQYDVRYSTALITSENFYTHTRLTTVISPSVSGTIDTATITGLTPNTGYYVAIKTADEVPNWSEISNVVAGITRTGGDTVPPAAVTNMWATVMRQTSVVLSWTAPGDDHLTGQAAAYDIRYATTPVDAATWEFAMPASNIPQPKPAGSEELIEVGGLNPATEYYFAFKTVDTAGNWSELSNVVSATTSTHPDTWHAFLPWTNSNILSVAPSSAGGYVLMGNKPDIMLAGRISDDGILLWDYQQNMQWHYEYDMGDIFVWETGESWIVGMAPAENGGCVLATSTRSDSWSQTFEQAHTTVRQLDQNGYKTWIYTASCGYVDGWVTGESIIEDIYGGYFLLANDLSCYRGTFVYGISSSGGGTGRGGELGYYNGEVGAYAMCQLTDGNLTVIGDQANDVWVEKYDSDFNSVWKTTVDLGGGTEHGVAGIGTNDGGLIVAAKPAVLVKLDQSGQYVWDIPIDGILGYERYLIKTPDGNNLLAGSTDSFGNGNSDILLVKFTEQGEILWTKTVGTDEDEGANSLALAPDGGFVVVGRRVDVGSTVNRPYIVKVNANGEL
ncbi:fibronectin type III domain-containing protein [Candidatus Zixiibacteriota bacterium]